MLVNSKECGGETTLGRNDLGAKHPMGAKRLGENDQGETSWGRNELGRKWFGGETTRNHKCSGIILSRHD